MSQEGINTLLKQFEGCKLASYRCPANVLTVGYGHTSAAGSPEVTEGMKITQAQANTILTSDLVKFENGVEGLLKQPVTQGQFDVLVDFAYNAGLGNILKSQKACGNPSGYDPIMVCLPQITGSSAKETLDYAPKIYRWGAAKAAGSFK